MAAAPKTPVKSPKSALTRSISKQLSEASPCNYHYMNRKKLATSALTSARKRSQRLAAQVTPSYGQFSQDSSMEELAQFELGASSVRELQDRVKPAHLYEYFLPEWRLISLYCCPDCEIKQIKCHRCLDQETSYKKKLRPWKAEWSVAPRLSALRDLLPPKSEVRLAALLKLSL